MVLYQGFDKRVKVWYCLWMDRQSKKFPSLNLLNQSNKVKLYDSAGEFISVIDEMPGSTLGYPETDEWWKEFRKEKDEASSLLDNIFTDKLVELQIASPDNLVVGISKGNIVREAWEYAKKRYAELQERGES